MMRMLAALVGRSLRRSWIGLTGVVVVLSACQVAAVLIASSLERNRSFAQLAAIVPALVGEAVGGTVQMVASFGGMVGFGFFHPVVIFALVQGAVYLASEPADEVERGLVDLVAARPLPRHLMVTRTLVATTAAVALTVAAMIATSVVAVRLLAPEGARPLGFSMTALLAGHLSAIALCFAAASLLIAAYVHRRSAPVGAVGLLAVFLFFVDFAASAWPTLSPIAPFTPFYYYDGMAVLLGTSNPSRDLSVLLASAALLVVWAYVVYGRRDL
jgi:ABC-2 type transport system permease protein